MSKLPQPLAMQGGNDFFKTPPQGQKAIVRLIKADATSEYMYRYFAHKLDGDAFFPARNGAFIPVYCVGTPTDPTNHEFDNSGIDECSAIGPTGQGAFLHSYDYAPRFSCLLLVHEYAGIPLNKVQVWNRDQGSPTRGIYKKVLDALDIAEEQGLEYEDSLFSLKGIPVPADNRKTMNDVQYIGASTGNYEKYTLTDVLRKNMMEQAVELKGLVVPYKTAAQVKTFLGLSVDTPDVAPYESGTDAAPAQVQPTVLP